MTTHVGTASATAATGFRAGPVRVRVPATSANLGPGFDSLAVALEIYDEVTVGVVPEGLIVEVRGEAADDVPRDASHLVVRAMRAAFARVGAPPSGLTVSCVNRIPHGRGLGSSAAAIVAGVLAARALAADGQTQLSEANALALAAELEGHPDNVAACLLGGVTVAWTDAARARAVGLPFDPRVRPVAFVPPFTSATAVARATLPDTVPHEDAAFTAGRAALLVAALTADHLDLLPVATQDRLHQPYRLPVVPETEQLLAALHAAGVPAMLSGAGPAVLALTRSTDEEARAVALAPDGWRARPASVDPSGARITVDVDGTDAAG